MVSLLTDVQLSHPAAWSRDVPSRFARCRAGETPSRHLSGWSLRRGLANTPSHKLQHPLQKVSSKQSFQLVHDSVRETIPTCTVHGHAQVIGRKVPCRRYTSSYSRHGQALHDPCMLELPAKNRTECSFGTVCVRVWRSVGRFLNFRTPMMIIEAYRAVPRSARSIGQSSTELSVHTVLYTPSNAHGTDRTSERHHVVLECSELWRE
jgi:hypothetical protein